MPLDAAEMERWRSEASRVRAGAARDREAGDHSLACFRAEQAVQLAVKGLLHAVGAPAWGHDLTVLGALLRERLGDELWPDRVDAPARRLSFHYTASRYPDAFPEGTPSSHYDAEMSQGALVDAGAVLAEVDRAWAALGRVDESG